MPVYPVRYVQYFKPGLDAHSRDDHVTAVAYYDSALQVSPEPYYPYLVYQRAYSLLRLGRFSEGEAAMNSLLARDSMVFEAHKDLYFLAMSRDDPAKAEIHKRWLQKLVPWYWPRVESLVRQQLRRGGG